MSVIYHSVEYSLSIMLDRLFTISDEDFEVCFDSAGWFTPNQVTIRAIESAYAYQGFCQPDYSMWVPNVMTVRFQFQSSVTFPTTPTKRQTGSEYECCVDRERISKNS